MALHAEAGVGVSFLDGVAALHPMGLTLDPNRRRWAPGAAPVGLAAQLAPPRPAARHRRRRLRSVCSGELDPAHITAEGVRHITPDARLLAMFGLSDGGLQRRMTAGASRYWGDPDTGLRFRAARTDGRTGPISHLAFGSG
ncbi:MAG: hypothetical protein MZV65_39405 [Chromatiales bacterium]|nr:hypothetical protein [Chromatiales bacterium]